MLHRAGPPSILESFSWWTGARSELVPPYFETGKSRASAFSFAIVADSAANLLLVSHGLVDDATFDFEGDWLGAAIDLQNKLFFKQSGFGGGREG